MIGRIAQRVAVRMKGILTPLMLRRLMRREDGSVAVEFGLVALPFFALIMAMAETALMVFANQTLELAVANSSRLIMTGQAQSLDYAAFKNQVCARIYAMFDCVNGIQLDVRTASSFSGTDLSKPLDANGNLTITPTFNPGGPGAIVVVRVVYKWPVWAQFGGIALIDMAGSSKLLMTTVVFRNEP